MRPSGDGKDRAHFRSGGAHFPAFQQRGGVVLESWSSVTGTTKADLSSFSKVNLLKFMCMFTLFTCYVHILMHTVIPVEILCCLLQLVPNQTYAHTHTQIVG